MRKKAWLFLGCLIPLSGAGALLRSIELRTALDESTMLMDLVPASFLLLALSALVMVLMGLLARGMDTEAVPRRYNRCFGGVGTLAVSGVCLLMMLFGALLCMQWRSGKASQRLFLELLALTAALAGAAWLALGLDGWRKKKADSLLSAVFPVIFCGFFLVFFYKTYAQLPALLYSLYPFLGLCASLAALHLIAGFTVDRFRPRLTLFLCGSGCYFCVISAAGVTENAYRLFLGAIALELAAHGAAMLLPHPPEPETEKEEAGKKPEGETTPEEDALEETPAETEASGETPPETEASEEDRAE